MMKNAPPRSAHVPSLRAVAFDNDSQGDATKLTNRQRQELTGIAARLRLPALTTIYRAGSKAEWVFAVDEGAVKSYRDLRSGRRVLNAFLFAGDLFGLAEKGRFINTVQTITRVTLYRLPLDELTRLVKRDPELQFKFLIKVTHELRESQRRAILIGRRDAAGRLAMFLSLVHRLQPPADRRDAIRLPMTRADIADFLNLSPETVSRAAAALEQRGLVIFDSPHRARILDAGRLAELAAAL